MVASTFTGFHEQLGEMWSYTSITFTRLEAAQIGVAEIL
jgi:hypothetical protein